MSVAVFVIIGKLFVGFGNFCFNLTVICREIFKLFDRFGNCLSISVNLSLLADIKISYNRDICVCYSAEAFGGIKTAAR